MAAKRINYRDSPATSRTHLINTPASSTASLVPNTRQMIQKGPPPSMPHAAFSQGPRPRMVGATAAGQPAGRPDFPDPDGPSISSKFALSANPSDWGAFTSVTTREPDDDLHNPDPQRDRKNDQGGSVFTARGFANLGCLIVLCVGLVALFAGYPMLMYFLSPKPTTNGGFNIGGINGSGQIPTMPGNFALIDPHTPDHAKQSPSWKDGTMWDLVFSDEFNVENRSFYSGDDPYWEAVDLHYWATNNLEWYDPKGITTEGGSLKLTLTQEQTHNLNYSGGMMSSWNKFCFTGGYIEVNVSLPGLYGIEGLWPAVWMLGNLGRAGYGGTLDGMWPYTYDSCDVGTLPNQTLNGQPAAALVNGDKNHGGELNWLPGQRLSRCTCQGENHPGPIHPEDGSFVGRGAPEIDVFEAQAQFAIGAVSQSGQWAPFNHAYKWLNTTGNYEINNVTDSSWNTYTGSVLQQATSVVTRTNPGCYTMEEGCFAVYGVEYEPGPDGYITWIANGVPAWTIRGSGMAADPLVGIGARPIPEEPLYILMNLGMSRNFGPVDLEHLIFPVSMLVDYVRVYQPPDALNIGCDPAGFPTGAYINQYIGAYTNPNYTTFMQATGENFPKNNKVDNCT